MIKHVSITNYKSLGKVSVSLEPVTVLIGRSGAGKSNFVEALRFLRDYLTHRNESHVQQLGGWPRVLSATAPPPLTLSFQVRFDAPGISEDFEYILTFQQQPNQPRTSPPQLRDEVLSLGGRILFRQQHGQWFDPPALVNPPQAGSLMLGALTGLPEVSIAHLVLTNGIGCYAFPNDVLLNSNPRQNETGLSDTGDNYLQSYRAISINLETWRYPKEIVAALRQLNPSIKSVELEMPSANRIVVSHQVGDLALVLDLPQESEGLRRFLAHLIALYQTPAKQTLVFEEPEKGIHPGALQALTDQFRAYPDTRHGQVILTTHSPELLDHFEPEQLRVVEMHDHVTTVGPLGEEQKEAIREQLLRPGELLTVDRARMTAA